MFKKYIVCSSQCRRGKISVGENSTEQKVFTPGLNKNILLTSSTSNSVMKQFAKQGVPITYMRHSKHHIFDENLMTKLSSAVWKHNT